MVELPEDVMKLIEKQLPAVTAGLMSKYIEDSEQMLENLEELSASHNEALATIKEQRFEIYRLNEKIKSYDDIEIREDALKANEDSLNIKNNEYEVRVLNIMLKEQIERNALVERLVDKVFGHPSVTIVKNRSEPIVDNNGCQIGLKNSNDLTTEAKGKS